MALVESQESTSQLGIGMPEYLTRRAAEAYKAKDYGTALELYEQVASVLGRKIVNANIVLCLRRLGLPSSGAAAASEHDAPTTTRARATEYTSAAERLAEHSRTYFPRTNSKLQSYATEAVLENPGNFTLLGKLSTTRSFPQSVTLGAIIASSHLRNFIDRKPKLLIAGHDLRFINPLIQWLSRYFEVQIDRWSATGQHDPEASKRLLDRADIIWCEWCCGNAVWYSNHIASHQELIVRLHRFEIETDYPSQVRWDRVRALIFISEGMQIIANRRLRLPCTQYVLYNGFDVDEGMKFRTARRDPYSLAMLGVVPKLKRLDLAVDFFETARDLNPNYSLHLKGRSAHQISWVWERESDFFEQMSRCLHRLRTSGASINEEPYDGQVPSWLSTKGFLLSTSDVEGSHQAVAEAMACGTIPVIVGEWQKAYFGRLMYPSDFCFASLPDALDFVDKLASSSADYEMVSARCRDFAHENFNHIKIAHGALRILAGQESNITYIPIGTPRHIIVFSDLDPNTIDGSSIWLFSFVELLLQDRNLHVILICKEKPRNHEQVSNYLASGRFSLEIFSDNYTESRFGEFVDFWSSICARHGAYRTIARLSHHHANITLERATARQISSTVYYLVGDEYPSESLLRSAYGILVQTEEARRRLMASFSEWIESKRVGVLRPMIPEAFRPVVTPPSSLLTIAYTGKVSRGYAASEMAAYIASAPPDVRFCICVAKYHRSDPDTYLQQVRASLENSQREGRALVLENLSRSEVIHVLGQAHIGWAFRSAEYRESSEISTKLLEYCALGKPVIANKFQANINLLGDDYPLYVEDPNEIGDILRALRSNTELYTELAQHCVDVSSRFRLHAVYSEIADFVL